MFNLNEQEVLYNEEIKKKVLEKRNFENSSKYIFDEKINKLKKYGVLKLIKNKIEIYTDPVKRDMKKCHDKYGIINREKDDRNDTNYVNTERIAVYTCITGGYDKLIEPHIKPDNIDYYAITDFEIPKNSLWKRIDINSFENTKSYSNPFKNRFVKMNPHIVFPDYKYSIYVDGNIEIYTDFTEHVNRISKYGIAFFRHPQRTCVYEEAEAVKLLRKVDNNQLDKYINKLSSNSFPKNYGLLYCGLIVREHNSKQCLDIDEQWWNEFKDNINRDQIVLPYILYKNNIKVDELATLGNNLYDDLSFDIVSHK